MATTIEPAVYGLAYSAGPDFTAAENTRLVSLAVWGLQHKLTVLLAELAEEHQGERVRFEVSIKLIPDE